MSWGSSQACCWVAKLILVVIDEISVILLRNVTAEHSGSIF